MTQVVRSWAWTHLHDLLHLARDAAAALEVKVGEAVLGQDRGPGLDGELRKVLGRLGHAQERVQLLLRGRFDAVESQVTF